MGKSRKATIIQVLPSLRMKSTFVDEKHFRANLTGALGSVDDC